MSIGAGVETLVGRRYGPWRVDQIEIEQLDDEMRTYRVRLVSPTSADQRWLLYAVALAFVSAAPDPIQYLTHVAERMSTELERACGERHD